MGSEYWSALSPAEKPRSWAAVVETVSEIAGYHVTSDRNRCLALNRYGEPDPGKWGAHVYVEQDEDWIHVQFNTGTRDQRAAFMDALESGLRRRGISAGFEEE